MSLLPSSAQPFYFSLQRWQLKPQQSASNQTPTIGFDIPVGKSPSVQLFPSHDALKEGTTRSVTRGSMARTRSAGRSRNRAGRGAGFRSQFSQP